jgi:DNA replication protein DnaC
VPTTNPANIPAKVLLTSWDDLEQTAEVRMVRRWADSFEMVIDPAKATRDTLGAGLFLTGPRGLGKTTLAAMALKSIIEQRYIGWYVTAPTLEEMLMERIALSTVISKGGGSESQFESWEAINTRLHKARLTYECVVLDDIGRERSASSYVRDFIEGLVRARYDRGLPTIVTSNMSYEDFNETWGAQAVSFLREACKLIRFAGEDRR